MEPQNDTWYSTARIWAIAVLVAWIFDLLFWRKTPGLSFPLFIGALLAGGLTLARLEGRWPHARGLVLLLPIFFFSTASVVRREPLTVFLSMVIALASTGLLASTYLGGRWIQYSLADQIKNFFVLALSMLFEPFTHYPAFWRYLHRDDQGTSRWKQSAAVLRGLLLALPMIAVFAALLASADLVFSAVLDAVLEYLNLEHVFEYIFRGIYILAIAHGISGLYSYAFSSSQDENLIGLKKPLVPPVLGFLEAVIVLASVDLLFGIFVGIQFRYLFGGVENISVEGYTYAEYARRGFGELVLVAFISFLLLAGLSSLTKKESEGRRLTFSALSAILVLSVAVMLVSAFQRLLLYENTFGFTRLRTYAHVFMVWLGMVLIITLILEILRRPRGMGLTLFLASLGFAASLNALNVDAFIVTRNVGRVGGGADLDAWYLTTLSDDAALAFEAAYDGRDLQRPLPAALRQEIGQAWACHAASRNFYTQEGPWPTYQLARGRARLSWHAHLQRLAADGIIQITDEAETVLSLSTTELCPAVLR